MGRHLRAYSVSPFWRLKMAGPMPMENSFTLTPRLLAAMKWPNSCMPTRMPKAMIAMTMNIRNNAP